MNTLKYSACGLDYIHLANGYRLEKTPYGEGITIDNADLLHAAIASVIIKSSTALRGQEVRFLRANLGISQKELGQALGVTRLAVARWEGRPNQVIPGPADRALRFFYVLKNGENPQGMDNLFFAIAPHEHGNIIFVETKENWAEAA